MPTIGANVLTLSDWAKRVDPNGRIARIAELLMQSNQILDDMVMVEGNQPTGHVMTVRTGYPTPVWRLLNQGVQPTKTTTAQIVESIGMLEDWTEVDKDLAELNGNVNEFRLSEARGKIEAINQEVASTLFFGNSGTAPEEFTGFATRYNALTGANISQNVIDGGGSGSDNSSVWLVVWSPETVFTVFPRGSQMGLVHENLGLGVVETTAGIAGNRMMAYRDRWQWKIGLAVKDWRYAVRIANVDISNLVAKSSAADLVDLMIRAIHRIPNMGLGRPAFYMNRTCRQMLDIQRRDSMLGGTGLQYREIDGKLMPFFRDVPIKTVDALVETEAAVT